MLPASLCGAEIFGFDTVLALLLVRCCAPAPIVYPRRKDPMWRHSLGLVVRHGVGYGTFLVEHLIFGLFLGLIPFMGVKRAH